MKVLVDTSVWSLVLRRQNIPAHPVTVVFRELIEDGRVELLGAVRQEILSGLRETNQFNRLRAYLKAFPDVALTQEDYETAAEFFNRCRQAGIQGSQADFLICAVAVRRQWQILTTDQDFMHYQRQLPLQLVSDWPQA